MVIDTSALVAILTQEPAAERLVAAIDADTRRLISAATVVELSLVMSGRYGEAGDGQIDRLLAGLGAMHHLPLRPESSAPDSASPPDGA